MGDATDRAADRPGGPDKPRRGKRAVVLLAKGEAAELADRYRRRFDPEWFERVPPHVSLLASFEPDGSDEALAVVLERAVSGLAPFFLRLGQPDAFAAPRLVLYLPVENDAPVCELQRRAERAISCGARPFPFSPHLTMGRFASQDALAPALAELTNELAARGEGPGPLGFRVEEVHLFGEDPESGVYTSKARAALSGE